MHIPTIPILFSRVLKSQKRESMKLNYNHLQKDSIADLDRIAAIIKKHTKSLNLKKTKEFGESEQYYNDNFTR